MKTYKTVANQDGKTRDMGLGPLHTITLAEARELATQKRKLRLEGIDPIEARAAQRQAQRIEAAKAITFDECAEQYIAAKGGTWRNAKHRQQWTNTLTTYVSPVFGSTPVQQIDTPLVLKVLKPIWSTKPETASRVRGRIEAILDWARAGEYRTGENPGRWIGHLEHLLAARGDVQKVEHHPALPWSEINSFMIELQTREGMSAQVLEFTVLTAARTNESIAAQWSEIDLESKVWTIPAERMKSGRVHRVPLSPRALAILKALPRKGPFIFGESKSKPPSNMAMLMLLRRMGRDDLTVHGFRSTFRDWAFERSNFPREIVEAALAHVVGDKTEAAYKRGEALLKRRRLMEAWADFCAQPAKAKGDVVSIAAMRR